MKIDLQLHSTYSDGYLTPTELAKQMNGLGVKAAALTDHNTVSGLGEFRKACAHYKIKVIPGLELYAKISSKRFNLLWYNYDPSHPALHDMLRESQIRRRQRIRRIMMRLADRGYKLDADKILDKYNHYVPINHVVEDIISQPGNMSRIKKDFELFAPREEDMIKKLFFDKEIGVLHESNINAEKIFALRKKIGGQLIYCHPGKYNMPTIELLTRLKKLGLDGLEILSPHHTYGAIVYLQDIATRLNLITTGGSDFHRLEGSAHPIQHSGQYFAIDSNLLKGINKIIG